MAIEEVADDVLAKFDGLEDEKASEDNELVRPSVC